MKHGFTYRKKGFVGRIGHFFPSEVTKKKFSFRNRIIHLDFPFSDAINDESHRKVEVPKENNLVSSSGL